MVQSGDGWGHHHPGPAGAGNDRLPLLRQGGNDREEERRRQAVASAVYESIPLRSARRLCWTMMRRRSLPGLSGTRCVSTRPTPPTLNAAISPRA